MANWAWRATGVILSGLLVSAGLTDPALASGVHHLGVSSPSPVAARRVQHIAAVHHTTDRRTGEKATAKPVSPRFAGRRAHAVVMSAVTVPPAPFVTAVAAEGLGLLVSWVPSDPALAVTGYTVRIGAAAGGSTPVSGCAGPFVSSVDSSQSAALVEGLCSTSAYTATVTAANAAGTSAGGSPSDPVVPLPAQAPSAPLITGVYGRDESLLVTFVPAEPGRRQGDQRVHGVRDRRERDKDGPGRCDRQHGNCCRLDRRHPLQRGRHRDEQRGDFTSRLVHRHSLGRPQTWSTG